MPQRTLRKQRNKLYYICAIYLLFEGIFFGVSGKKGYIPLETKPEGAIMRAQLCGTNYSQFFLMT